MDYRDYKKSYIETLDLGGMTTPSDKGALFELDLVDNFGRLNTSATTEDLYNRCQRLNQMAIRSLQSSKFGAASVIPLPPALKSFIAGAIYLATKIGHVRAAVVDYILPPIPQKFTSLEDIFNIYEQRGFANQLGFDSYTEDLVEFLEKVQEYIPSKLGAIRDEISSSNIPIERAEKTFNEFSKFTHNLLEQTSASFPLWEIKQKDCEGIVYLLGSIHVGNERTQEFVDQTVSPLMKKCTSVWTEVKQFSIIPELYSQFWSEKNSEKMKRVIEINDFSMKVMKQSRLSPHLGLDTMISMKAYSEGKELNSLENRVGDYEELLKIYEGQDLQKVQELEILIDSFNLGLQLLKTYRGKELNTSHPKETLERYEVREDQMIGKIGSLFSTQQNHLCVVGLDHCRVNAGLPDRLKALGYTVRYMR